MLADHRDGLLGSSFCLILDNSVGLWVGTQSVGDFVYQTSEVRVLPLAEEDNLSHFVWKTACLCQRIKIDNKHVLYCIMYCVLYCVLHCIVLCIALYCIYGMVWYGMVWDGMVWYALPCESVKIKTTNMFVFMHTSMYVSLWSISCRQLTWVVAMLLWFLLPIPKNNMPAILENILNFFSKWSNKSNFFIYVLHFCRKNNFLKHTYLFRPRAWLHLIHSPHLPCS